MLWRPVEFNVRRWESDELGRHSAGSSFGAVHNRHWATATCNLHTKQFQRMHHRLRLLPKSLVSRLQWPCKTSSGYQWSILHRSVWSCGGIYGYLTALARVRASKLTCACSAVSLANSIQLHGYAFEVVSILATSYASNTCARHACQTPMARRCLRR